MQTTFKGRWVIDTQLLVYIIDKKSSFHEGAREIFSHIKNGGLQAVIAQQNIIEAENVLLFAYHMKVTEVVLVVKDMIEEFSFTVITPLAKTYERFHKIMPDLQRRVDIFDFYLAATMLDNSISQIITANDKDFSSIKGMTAYNPWKNGEKGLPE